MFAGNRVFFLGIPVVVIAALLGWTVLSSRTPSYKLATVERGEIIQESLASGNVESPTTADLHFASAGTLVALSARTGQQVKAGAILAKQDTSVLEAQLAQALSQVAAQQAQLQSLLDGTRPEAIAVTQAQVSADQVALSRAQATEADALRSAYTAADSALQNALDPLFNNPHSSSPQLLFFVNDTSLENAIEGARVSLGPVVAAFGSSVSVLSGDPASLEPEANAALAAVSSLLAQANSALSQATPNAQASATQISAWSASVASARSSINTAITTLSGATTARESAQALLEKDQKTLALQQAGATQASLDAQHAAISAAQAQVASIRAQIRNLEIIAPFSGTVTDTNGTVGESITPGTIVVSLQPYQELQLKVNVSEDNIVGVKPGDPVRIELDAFPVSTEFAGKVSEVDPAQTELGGAIYYQTTILFAQQYPGIKPGMTANVWIETASSSDALIVPASAIADSGKEKTVEVLSGDATETRTITTGIESSDGRVQILSGLSEGEQVVLGK